MSEPFASTRIFDGNHLRCTVFGAGPRIFATFDNYVIQKSGFGDSNPSRKIIAAGFRHVAVQTSGNDWYLNGDLQEMLDLLRNNLAVDGPSHSLGFSMGGFAALLFAPSLKTTDLYLVSPRFPRPVDWVGKAKINCDDRFLTADWPETLLKAAQLAPRTTIFFDPRHHDDRMATRWLAKVNPNVSSLALGFGGHPCTGYIRDSQLFGSMQDILLKPAFDTGDLIHLKKKARLVSPSYKVKTQSYLAARQSRAAFPASSDA